MKQDFMKEAIELAKKGERKVFPNPLVGCMIVKNGKVVGRGYHKKFGKKHAEINALQEAGSKAKGAEMYVSLEPCCHFGKTPPCVDKIIDAGIKKVFVAVKDPSKKVCGKGISKLKKNGIKVELGLMKKEAIELNEAFFKFEKTGEPLVVLKIACSFNEKIYDYKLRTKWISGGDSRKLVHKMRNRYDSILVGINTVLKDNPKLTARVKSGANPVRIVLDSKLRIPLNSRLLKEEGKTIIFCYKGNMKKIKQLEKKDAEVLIVREKNGKVSLKEVLNKLGNKGITSVLVEGGREINTCFLKEKLVDKIVVFIAPKLIEKGLDAVKGVCLKEYFDKEVSDEKVFVLGKDLVLEGKVKDI